MAFSNKLYSPLRYPGGKAMFAPFLAKIIETNSLVGADYFEPYAGGAGVALNLLFSGYAKHIHINDVDEFIYAFWVSITEYSSDILNLIENTPITIDEWFKWRDVLRGKKEANLVEKGFATLFVNRTNRSGILNAGVIGGKSQNGIYKLDARFKKDVIIERIRRIAKYRENISVYNRDSLDLLETCSSFLPERTFIYLDPPYFIKGKGLYRNYYEYEDHLRISKLLQGPSFKYPWVVSYDNASEICKMYDGSRSIKYNLNYSLQRKYEGNEVVFFSNDLLLNEGNIIS